MKKTKINDLLPSEIIIEILSRMPVDSVLQCKRVCRTWRFLIEHDPTFLALHIHRFITSSSSSSSSSSSGGQLVIKSAPAAAADFSFFMLVNSRKRYYSIYDNNELYFGEYYNKKDLRKKTVKLSLNSIPSDRFHRLLNSDNIKCITSCNGLILIASISNSKDNNNNNSDDDYADMFVFNPVTREYVHLPRRPPPFEKYHYDGGGIGFGYHPITNEYKVVRITSSSSSSENCISVYTLGSGIWRKSKGETKTNINLGGGGGGGNNKMYHLRWDTHPAVLLNGVLHWPTKQYGYVGILSFDLADEELKIFPLPPLEQHPFFWHSDPIQLGVLGGCLCWSTASVGTPLRVDIWVLNKLGEEDHNQEYSTTAAASSCSWTKKYSLSTGAAVGLHVRGEEYKIVADLGGGKILFSRFDHCELKFSFVSCDSNVEEDLDENRWFGTVGSNRWSTTMIKKLPHMIPYMKSFVSLKVSRHLEK